MSALAPCPFCGGTDAFVERADFSSAYVQCDSSVGHGCACMARGPLALQEDDGEDIPGQDAAIAAWNRRAPLPADQPSNPVPRMGGITNWLTDKQKETIERAARVAENSGHPRLADSLRGILARIVGQQTKGGAHD